MDLRHYPVNWREISRAIREREGWRCKRCGAVNGEPHPVTGSRVVLTVAHLCECRDAEGRKCGDPDHLEAQCQRCHLALDHPMHMRHAAETRRRRRGVLELFPTA